MSPGSKYGGVVVRGVSAIATSPKIPSGTSVSGRALATRRNLNVEDVSEEEMRKRMAEQMPG